MRGGSRKQDEAGRAMSRERVARFAVTSLRGLAFFDDAEKLPMPRMIDKTPWSKMKKILEQQALAAGRKQLGKFWE
jgi:hypothetical protein